MIRRLPTRSTPDTGSPRGATGSGRLRPGTARLAALGVVVGLGAATLPALADATLSPTTAEAGATASFVVRITDAGSVDLLSRVTVEHPDGWGFESCAGPSGWSCRGDGSSVTWQRQASLAVDDTFSMTLVAPAETGVATFTIVEQRASGGGSSDVVAVTVTPATPEEDEPSDEPTPSEEPSDDPSQEPTPLEESSTPPMEPFRPPDEDGPISIRDLPQEPEPAEASGEAVAAASSSGTDLAKLVFVPFALLLLLSATGFVVAQANR